MTIDWLCFAPLIVAMAAYLVGMLVCNVKDKDSQ